MSTGSTHELPLGGRQLREMCAVLDYLSEKGARARIVHVVESQRQRNTHTCVVKITGELGALRMHWRIGPRGGKTKTSWTA